MPYVASNAFMWALFGKIIQEINHSDSIYKQFIDKVETKTTKLFNL